MSSINNPGIYLRAQRNFPYDTQALSVELSKTYIDIAQKVNDRISGTFGVQTPGVTGESWFLDGEAGKQQTLRQVYSFTAAGSIPHGINTAQIAAFTRIYGTFTTQDSPPNFYPLPYVDVTAADNQISLEITSTDIVITAGGGSPPSIMSGIVVLEWLSNP